MYAKPINIFKKINLDKLNSQIIFNNSLPRVSVFNFSSFAPGCSKSLRAGSDRDDEELRITTFKHIDHEMGSKR